MVTHLLLIKYHLIVIQVTLALPEMLHIPILMGTQFQVILVTNLILILIHLLLTVEENILILLMILDIFINIKELLVVEMILELQMQIMRERQTQTQILVLILLEFQYLVEDLIPIVEALMINQEVIHIPLSMLLQVLL